MGCGKDSMFKLAAAVGTSASNCASWSNADARKTIAGQVENKKRMAKYFSARKSGATKCATYQSDVPSQVADFEEASVDLGFCSDDLNSVIQCAGGEANLNIYYSSQYDPATGKEVNLECSQHVNSNNYPNLCNPYIAPAGSSCCAAPAGPTGCTGEGYTAGVFATSNRQVKLDQYYRA